MLASPVSVLEKRYFRQFSYTQFCFVKQRTIKPENAFCITGILNRSAVLTENMTHI